jgi:hypothetical protein
MKQIALKRCNYFTITTLQEIQAPKQIAGIPKKCKPDTGSFEPDIRVSISL